VRSWVSEYRCVIPHNFFICSTFDHVYKLAIHETVGIFNSGAAVSSLPTSPPSSVPTTAPTAKPCTVGQFITKGQPGQSDGCQNCQVGSHGKGWDPDRCPWCPNGSVPDNKHDECDYCGAGKIGNNIIKTDKDGKILEGTARDKCEVAPTPAPTSAPSNKPTPAPTAFPTFAPTPMPTKGPTSSPLHRNYH
jgi:hypothetical protein